jgi:hypothetical protein
MMVRPGRMVLLIAFGLLFLPQLFAAQEVVPKYDFKALTEKNVQTFLAVISAEKQLQEQKLTKKYPDRPEKVQNHSSMIAYAQIIEQATQLSARLKGNTRPSAEDEREFMRVQRLHYGILADIGGATQSPKIKRGLGMLTNISLGHILLNVPNVIDPNAPIGERAAKDEADRLYRPGGKAPVTAAEMATMGAREISHLQPVPGHAALSGLPVGNNFAGFAERMKKLIRLQGKNLKTFDSTYARRILFFDELKEDATSPKITVKDRYGLKWKLKWGDEVHTDVAMTRLYIDLGTSYTDLKYYSGPGESILILDPPEKNAPEAIKTFAAMADLLLKSKFTFHADRYLLPLPILKDKAGVILGSGIVDKAMIEKESIPEKYLGAHYVLFKECQLSLYNPAIQRLGGSSLSGAGADRDRVARGSMVFNCWIKNKDMKDDNSRVGLLFNETTGKFDHHVEFQSDLGCTLGALKPSGEINSLEKSFIIQMPTTVNFKMKPLYIPKSWKECTYADGRWMAMRIASLSRADLERCFLDCGWPVFVQRLAVEKLIARRNELVKAFKLELDGFKPLPCDPDVTIEVNTKNGKDFPVLKGKINSRSEVVRQLESATHPEGLAEIIPRKKD